MPGAGPHPHAVAARAPSGRHVRWPRPSRSNSTSFGLETLFTHMERSKNMQALVEMSQTGVVAHATALVRQINPNATNRGWCRPC